MSENNSAFWQKFLAGLCKLLSTCRWVHFENFFEKQIRYNLSFSHTEQTLFGIQLNFFQRGCQKKLSKISIIAGHWARTFLSFIEKIAAVLPELHSTCLQEQFERVFFLKKSLSFFLFYSDTERKKIAFHQLFRNSLKKINCWKKVLSFFMFFGN